MNYPDVISVLLMIASPALILYVYFKKRHRRVSRVDEGPLIGTDADRARSEIQVAKLPTDMRAEYAATKEVLDRFSTRQGYTASYMDEIADRLRAQGIECEVYFQPGAVPGLADSFLIQQGLFELWVEREKLDRARTILKLTLK